MKRNPIITLILLAVLMAACRKQYSVVQPSTQWDQFDAATTLPRTARAPLEGVYNFSDGAVTFGNAAAAKWSYTVNGTDTTYQLSFFCEKDIAYFICEGKRMDSTILLNGYWRKMANTQSGRVRLTVSAAQGGALVLRGGTIGADSIRITGSFGAGDNVPDQPLALRWARRLYNARPLEIVVHRGGGQTADLLAASENSAEIIPLAAAFGATGIEIDVRLTSDGVPVLYHDADLSERLIKKNGMVGPIESYTYAQLNGLVRLIRNGEHIPTLRQALDNFVYRTPLTYVWLDTKFDGPLDSLRALQVEYTQRAAAIGRHVEITIGIPNEDVLDHFKALPNYRNIPSVCEMDIQDVQDVNSTIWGPRWTLGLQNDKVDAMHAQGRRAFVWTLDIPENILQFMTDGHFDGILSNYPSVVAYYHYAQQ